MTLKPVVLGAAAIIGIGFLLHIVGLSTPEWATYEHTSMGLWQSCQCYKFSDGQKPDWIKASEATGVLGTVMGAGALLCVVIMVVMDLMDKECPRFLGILGFLGSLASCVLIIVCVAIFGDNRSKFYDTASFGYSFGLSITGAIITIIGGVIALVANLSHGSSTGHQRM